MTGLLICALVSAGSGVVVGYLIGWQQYHREAIRAGIDAHNEEPK